MIIDSENTLSIPRRLESWVDEYNAKIANISNAIDDFKDAGSALKAAATINGTWGEETIDVGNIYPKTIETSLRRSAWRHVWNSLRLSEIVPAKDKLNFENSLANPPPFDVDIIRATFGPYLQDPRGSILRGLAEVFSDLDPAYKSHEKVKIGVNGLPKRVIITQLNSYARGWGWDKVRDIINALAVYQGKPLVSNIDMAALRENGDALRESRQVLDPYDSVHEHRRRAERADPDKTVLTVGRDVWLKKFHNGNGHLFFGSDALRDINRALAEFYGDVLADCPDADQDRAAPCHTGTAVAKDLQYYPTPKNVINKMLSDYDMRGKRVLEPSCGDGRIMDALVAKGCTSSYGIEIDHGRMMEARRKGHTVICANFLEFGGNDFWSSFDMVVMNPPFYGKHYAKHVRHAMKFLKPKGVLVTILPATARYDHRLLDDMNPQWKDLQVGAFSESGTNICTTIATITLR